MKDKLVYVLILGLSTLLGAIGQLLFKLGFVDHGFLFMFLSLGIMSYLASSVFYFYVLGRTKLSWTYGFQGLSYLFVSIFAYLILNESIVPLRWMGIVLIVMGTAIIGLS